MSDPACTLVYVTAPNHDQALSLARALVEERLAACANILPRITALYWWEGSVNQDEEVALILKTSAERLETLTARVRELHSYACPCVVALPIAGGNPAFLDWIRAETA